MVEWIVKFQRSYPFSSIHNMTKQLIQLRVSFEKPDWHCTTRVAIEKEDMKTALVEGSILSAPGRMEWDTGIHRQKRHISEPKKQQKPTATIGAAALSNVSASSEKSVCTDVSHSHRVLEVSQETSESLATNTSLSSRLYDRKVKFDIPRQTEEASSHVVSPNIDPRPNQQHHPVSVDDGWEYVRRECERQRQCKVKYYNRCPRCQTKRRYGDGCRNGCVDLCPERMSPDIDPRRFSSNSKGRRNWICKLLSCCFRGL